MEEKNFSLTLFHLSQFFGDKYVWGCRTHEVVGYDKETNRFVIIEDGLCQGSDWMYQIWDFNDSEMTAEDWFFKYGKWSADGYGASLVCEERFNGFENLIFANTKDGFVHLSKKDVDELQAKGEKCFIVQEFELDGFDCRQYDENDFFAVIKAKDGVYKGVDAKSLDELRDKIAEMRS